MPPSPCAHVHREGELGHVRFVGAARSRRPCVALPTPTDSPLPTHPTHRQNVPTPKALTDREEEWRLQEELDALRRHQAQQRPRGAAPPPALLLPHQLPPPIQAGGVLLLLAHLPAAALL